MGEPRHGVAGRDILHERAARGNRSSTGSDAVNGAGMGMPDRAGSSTAGMPMDAAASVPHATLGPPRVLRPGTERRVLSDAGRGSGWCVGPPDTFGGSGSRSQDD